MMNSIVNLVKRSLATARRQIIALQLVVAAMLAYWIIYKIEPTICVTATYIFNLYFSHYYIGTWAILMTIFVLIIRELNRSALPKRCPECQQKVREANLAKKTADAKKKAQEKLDNMLLVPKKEEVTIDNTTTAGQKV